MPALVEVPLVAPNGVAYRQPVGLFINNEFVPSKHAKTIRTYDPATQEPITDVFAASHEDVDRAVKAARAAFDNGWADSDPAIRAKLLNRLAHLTEQNADVLATIESWDNGKPYTSAQTEDIPEVVDVFRYYAGWCDKGLGQVVKSRGNQLSYTIPEPIGVCGHIIPWNFPIVMLAWKLAPALAAGNTIVLKVSEQTPLSALFFSSIIREAGIPPGVVNILNGYGLEVGAPIASHPDIDKIAFTGSTPVGKEIMRLASATMKEVTLETGGKSPLIVFPDADLQAAAETGYAGIMGNAGQNCTANSKILVHESIHDQFLQRFVEIARGTKIGDPFDVDTAQGPQVNKVQFDRILSYIAAGHEEGATLAFGGKAFTPTTNTKGFFIEPTVFTDVTPSMRIYKEEIFGPFVVILPFRTEADAIFMANDTEYGLAAAVFTLDIRRAHRISRKLNAGTVWINTSQAVDPRIPFGGYKQSGIGREQGEAGLQANIKYKTIVVDLAQSAHDERMSSRL